MFVNSTQRCLNPWDTYMYLREMDDITLVQSDVRTEPTMHCKQLVSLLRKTNCRSLGVLVTLATVLASST